MEGRPRGQAPAPSRSLARADFAKLSLRGLRAHCRENFLDSSGGKTTLIARLLEFHFPSQGPSEGSYLLSLRIVQGLFGSNKQLDDDGASDPYVTCTLGGDSKSTRPVENEASPHWHEELQFALGVSGSSHVALTQQHLHIQARDADFL